MVRLWNAREKGENPPKRTDKSNFESTPLWTIDLCCILQESGIKFVFHTLCAGLTHHHYEIEWYAYNLEKDSRRVNTLFERAREEAWDVHVKETTTAEIINFLETGGICIVLLDANTLRDRHSSRDEETKEVPGYSGHYIVLVRYKAAMKCFSYLDPAPGAHTSESPNSISVRAFEAAWRTPGTDLDIIFCSR